MLNVGSRVNDSNGQGRILRDLRFEYLPIEEKERTRTDEHVPTYAELGFTEVRHSNEPVHLDPEFETFTYGHTIRGFGDHLLYDPTRSNIRSLIFYANLESADGWAPYIIGYFDKVTSIDCRKWDTRKVLSLRSRGFGRNAHLKRLDPQVDFLFKGREGSELLEKAVRLTERGSNSRLIAPLRRVITTSRGKPIPSGQPWYRWTMLCNDFQSLLCLIEKHRAGRS